MPATPIEGHHGRRSADLLMGLLALSALFVWGCAAEQAARQPSRPPNNAELNMGYQDAVDLATDYVSGQGMAGAELQSAEQVHPNVWRVRFGLAPKGSGRAVELYFEGTQRTLIRSEETRGVAGKLQP